MQRELFSAVIQKLRAVEYILSFLKNGIYNTVLERESYKRSAAGWCTECEANLGPNEGNIGVSNPRCDRLASQFLDAAEFFEG